MKTVKPYLTATNFWIAAALLLANAFAWFSVATQVDMVEVEPILHPEIAEIRAHWQARDAVGESFSVTVTNRMAMETLTWFMAPRDLPISHPQVAIHPDGVTGGALVHMMGLRTPVFGRATVWLENGRLEARVEEVGIAGAKAPDFVLLAVEKAQQVYAQLRLPIEITKLELREGEVYIEGVYR
ncbi:MAG: hypothetical protein KC443_10625 [Anaerolineales bacterium]|nr:hypothetical protein [Anaerolineales bacterium]